MEAIVYRGAGQTSLEEVPIPTIEGDEILVEVRCCGICGTDLKKIQYGLQEPPRIYGHEIAGVVASVGERVTRWQVGDRVVLHHHIPCGDCFYCRRRLYAQCPQYKRTGTTAGFDPAGGGFAQYVRVLNWIAARGVVKIPDGVPFERAAFLEPVNTCLKALERLAVPEGEAVLIFGLGPIGLILTQLARRRGNCVIGCEPLEGRRELAIRLGAEASLAPEDLESQVRDRTQGRGVDAVMLASEAPETLTQALRLSRPGARILVFAHTRKGDRQPVDLGSVCVDEKEIVGSYSASIDLQEKAARLVFEGHLELDLLVTHRFGLREMEAALALAARPSRDSLKIVIETHK